MDANKKLHEKLVYYSDDDLKSDEKVDNIKESFVKYF